MGSRSEVVLSDFLNEKSENELKESASTTIVKMTKKKKLNRLTGRASISIAKEKKDPLYERYRRLREKLMILKAKLVKKYKSRAKKVARKMLTSK
jgi:hypothetical protein